MKYIIILGLSFLILMVVGQLVFNQEVIKKGMEQIKFNQAIIENEKAQIRFNQGVIERLK